MNADIDIGGCILKTPRLLLRAFREQDLQDLYSYASQPGVGELAGWCHHKSMAESARVLNYFIKTKKTFAISLEGRVIGSLGVDNYDSALFPELDRLRGRELGFVLSRDFWNRGLMTEAVNAVCRWAFTEAGLDFLLCGCFGGNSASAAVQEKCGFKYYKEAPITDQMGRLRICIYSLLSSEEFRKP